MDVKEAMEIVTDLGHVVEDDSPGPPSNVSRATCTRCGKAVLCNAGHFYGSALTDPCLVREN